MVVLTAVLWPSRTKPAVRLLESQGYTMPEPHLTSVAECSLSVDTVFSRFNATADAYQIVNNVTEVEEIETNITETRGFNLFKRRPLMELRACWCSAQYFHRPMEYCPAEPSHDCIVHGVDGPVHCIASHSDLVRSMWPLAFVWLAGLVGIVYCSDTGRLARVYIRRRCCKEDMEAEHRNVQTLLMEEPERAAMLYRQAIWRNMSHQIRRRRTRTWDCCWRRGEQDNEPPAITRSTPFPSIPQDRLLLPTRIYQPERVRGTPAPPPANPCSRSWFRRDNEQVTLEEMDDEMEQGERCAICLVRLEPGVIVGDLSCPHVFHKECLKDWLPRRNACPLCQQTDIATFRPAIRRRHTVDGESLLPVHVA